MALSPACRIADPGVRLAPIPRCGEQRALSPRPKRRIIGAMTASPATAKTGLFPGTFDPITNGHVDVIQRGRMLFDRLVVAIGRNPDKQHLFTIKERYEMVHDLMAEVCPDAEVEIYDGLTVDHARRIGANAILRGIRNTADLNNEFQLALTNRAVADIETVFMMTADAHGFTSSSLIKQIAAGGQIDRLHRLLPGLVIDRLKAKCESHRDRIADLRTDAMQE